MCKITCNSTKGHNIAGTLYYFIHIYYLETAERRGKTTLKKTYTETTLLLLSQITFVQVHGLTWFWFQSVNWLFGIFIESFNATRASPVTKSIIYHVVSLSS
jgi:hypothetical protein